MNDWDWESDHAYSPKIETDKDKCLYHVWVPVLLLHFTVYDCKYCGYHKEKWEKEQCSK